MKREIFLRLNVEDKSLTENILFKGEVILTVTINQYRDDIAQMEHWEKLLC